MGVEGVTNQNYTQSSTVRNVKSNLGMDEFMKLLVTQLQNQDPLSPMEDKDFIAQMAQFNSLEEMKRLNDSYEFGSSLSLIGKNVTVKNTDGNGYISGMIDKVLMENGKCYITLDEYVFTLDDVVEVLSNK